MRRSYDKDRDVAAFATRQHGIVTREQMAQAGLSPSAIDRRIRAGRLIPLYRGVFALGHGAISERGRWMAATLACGTHAVLSHGTAAALWALTAYQPNLLHVTVPGTSGHEMPRGVRVHRYRSLDPKLDITRQHGIAVTTVERTLLDMATYLPLRRLRRPFDQAAVLRLLDYGEVQRLIAAHPRRRGTRAFVAVAFANRPRSDRTRSDFEERLVELCERHGLPTPRLNIKIAGLEVDALWAAERVVAEADSFTYHSTRARWGRDHERDAILTAAGYFVHRFTEDQVDGAPESVAASIRRSLSDRRRIAPPT